MSKWIKGLLWMTSHSHSFEKVGDIISYMPYIRYYSGKIELELEGKFSLKELQDLVDHMKKYGGAKC